MNIVQEIEKEHAAALAAKRPVPAFRPGDTVRVNVRVTEGERSRIQAYEGVCIARSGAGINESFTVRKISYGEGVERVFPVHSPAIESIEIRRRGKVRRAKLYYLRERRGKSARIPERQDARHSARKDKQAAPAKPKGPLFTRPAGDADDFTRINSIDATLSGSLQALGLARFEQIANLSDEDIAKVDEALALDGRIESEDWIEQAKALVAEATAHEVPEIEEPAEADAASETEEPAKPQ